MIFTQMRAYKERLFNKDGVDVFVYGWLYEDGDGHELKVPSRLIKMWRPDEHSSFEVEESRLSYRVDEVAAIRVPGAVSEKWEVR